MKSVVSREGRDARRWTAVQSQQRDGQWSSGRIPRKPFSSTWLILASTQGSIASAMSLGGAQLNAVFRKIHMCAEEVNGGC